MLFCRLTISNCIILQILRLNIQQQQQQNAYQTHSNANIIIAM